MQCARLLARLCHAHPLPKLLSASGHERFFGALAGLAARTLTLSGARGAPGAKVSAGVLMFSLYIAF
jgi:hypothetical protein